MRLLSLIAVLVLSQVTSAIDIARAAVPSTMNHQVSTPEPGLCGPVAAAPSASWMLPVYDAQIAGVGVDESRYRCLVGPGVDVGSHEHFGWFLFHVESGTITFTVEEGIMWAHCAAGCIPGGPVGSEGEETLLPGTTVTLDAGDWVLQDRATTHAFSNIGSGKAVILTVGGNSRLNGDGGCRGAC